MLMHMHSPVWQCLYMRYMIAQRQILHSLSAIYGCVSRYVSADLSQTRNCLNHCCSAVYSGVPVHSDDYWQHWILRGRVFVFFHTGPGSPAWHRPCRKCFITVCHCNGLVHKHRAQKACSCSSYACNLLELQCPTLPSDILFTNADNIKH